MLAKTMRPSVSYHYHSRAKQWIMLAITLSLTLKRKDEWISSKSFQLNIVLPAGIFRLTLPSSDMLVNRQNSARITKNFVLKSYINYMRDDERLTSHRLILLRICLGLQSKQNIRPPTGDTAELLGRPKIITRYPHTKKYTMLTPCKVSLRFLFLIKIQKTMFLTPGH